MEDNMQDKDMKRRNEGSVRRLILKGLLFSLPFWMVVVLYFYDDPFMVLRRYSKYDSDIMLCESCVGWNIYLNNRDSIPFNSFIMGNSCTMAFQCHEWEKYLDGGRAVRLFGNAESMMAVYKKLQALEREKADIRNVLLVIDHISLSKTRLLSGFSNVLPPSVSGEGTLSFQLESLQAFVLPGFLMPYLRYRLSGRTVLSGKGFNPYGQVRNPINNDAINPREKMILEEGEQYWQSREKEFPFRSGKPKTASRVVFASQEKLLTDIATLLHRNHAQVKIIISPDYSQESANPDDVKVLRRLFGAENVFDFTGINEYTADIHGYYEQGHYRPCLGNRLMEFIYGKHREYCNVVP